MIAIRRISNVKPDEFDEVWAIVRSMKQPSSWIKQVTALSPEKSIFWHYLDLKKAGNWNENTFATDYVPAFISQLHNDPEAINMLNTLYQLDKAGKNICLVCFCMDETMCHRSIIAGLLQAVGCNVVTETGNDYRKYYDLFKK